MKKQNTLHPLTIKLRESLSKQSAGNKKIYEMLLIGEFVGLSIEGFSVKSASEFKTKFSEAIVTLERNGKEFILNNLVARYVCSTISFANRLNIDLSESIDDALQLFISAYDLSIILDNKLETVHEKLDMTTNLYMNALIDNQVEKDPLYYLSISGKLAEILEETKSW